MNQPRLLPDVLLFCGALSLIAAAISGEMAWLHMRALSDVCGALRPHCVWCPAGVGFGTFGAVLLAARAALGPKCRPIKLS